MPVFSALKMEAVYSAETLVSTYQTKRSHNKEGQYDLRRSNSLIICVSRQELVGAENYDLIIFAEDSCKWIECLP
jgi:hypothetical protein